MRWNLRMDVEAIMARVSGEHGGRVADDRDDLLRRRPHRRVKLTCHPFTLFSL